MVDPKMRRSLRAALSLALLLVLSVSRLSGWGLTWLGTNLEQLVNSARLAIGPFRFNAALRITNTGYDSNLYPGRPGPPVEDYTSTVGPDISLFLPIKNKIVFELYEYPHYAFFLKTKDERGWNNILRGQAHFAWQKIYMLFGGSLTDLRERFSTEVDIRLRRKENSLFGSVLYQTDRSTSFLIQARRSKYIHIDSPYGSTGIPQQLDRIEAFISMRPYFQRNPYTRMFLEGEFGSYQFTEDSSSKDSRSYTFRGGVEFLEPSNLRGVVNLGYKYLDHLLTLDNDYKGLIGDATLMITVWKYWELRGSFKRDAEFSAWADSIYYIQTSYGPGISYLFSQRIKLGYDFTLGRNSYPSPPVDSGEDPVLRYDKFYTHAWKASFRLARTLDLGIAVILYTRKSSLDWINDRRNYYGFDLIYGF